MTRLRRHLAAAAALGVLAVSNPQTTTAALRPTIHFSEPDAVGAPERIAASTQLFKFSSVVAGNPVRWNPCAPIHWRFRTAGAPTGSGPIVMNAFAQISAATGITFVYDGTSTATPSTAWLPTISTGIRPLLIGWTDAAHSDLLRSQPASVLGITRTAYFGISVNGVQLAATKAAVVALNRSARLPLTGSVSWRATILHELGHAMGLDHVGNRRELMYPVLQRGVTGLQSGDRAGLARLGRTSGCIDLGF